MKRQIKRWFGALSLTILLAANGLPAQQSVSMNVERTTLGRLLRSFDRTTGMNSTVPPELANRIVSVHFSELAVNDAVRKIFEDLPLDYVFIEGRGIVVTGVSNENAPPEQPTPFYEDESERPDLATQRVLNIPPPSLPEPVVPTPFGPMLKRYAQNPIVQLPPVPGEPPAPPFFFPQQLPAPPAGAANGPTQPVMFSPMSIYQQNVAGP